MAFDSQEFNFGGSDNEFDSLFGDLNNNNNDPFDDGSSFNSFDVNHGLGDDQQDSRRRGNDGNILPEIGEASPLFEDFGIPGDFSSIPVHRVENPLFDDANEEEEGGGMDLDEEQEGEDEDKEAEEDEKNPMSTKPPPKDKTLKRKVGRPPGSKGKNPRNRPPKKKAKRGLTNQDGDDAVNFYTFFTDDIARLRTYLLTNWQNLGSFVFKNVVVTFRLDFRYIDSENGILYPADEKNQNDFSENLAGKLYLILPLPFHCIIELADFGSLINGAIQIGNVNDFIMDVNDRVGAAIQTKTFEKFFSYTSFVIHEQRRVSTPEKQSYLQRQLACFLVMDIIRFVVTIGYARIGDNIKDIVFEIIKHQANKHLTIIGTDNQLSPIEVFNQTAYRIIAFHILNGPISSVFGFDNDVKWTMWADTKRLDIIKLAINCFLMSKTTNTLDQVYIDLHTDIINTTESEEQPNQKRHASYYYALPSLPEEMSISYEKNFKRPGKPFAVEFLREGYTVFESIARFDLAGRNTSTGPYVHLPGEFMGFDLGVTMNGETAVKIKPVEDPFRTTVIDSKFHKLIEFLRYIWLSLVPQYERVNPGNRSDTELSIGDRSGPDRDFDVDLVNLLLVSDYRDTIIPYSELMNLVRAINTVISRGFSLDYKNFTKNRNAKNMAIPPVSPANDELDFISDESQRSFSVKLLQYLHGSAPGFVRQNPGFYNDIGKPTKNFRAHMTTESGIGDKTKPPIALRVLKVNALTSRAHDSDSLPHYSLELIPYNFGARQNYANNALTAQYLFSGLGRIAIDPMEFAFDIPSNAIDIFTLVGNDFIFLPSGRTKSSNLIVALGGQNRFTELGFIVYYNSIQKQSYKSNSKAANAIIPMGSACDGDFIQCLRQMLYRGSLDRDGLLDMYYKRVVLEDPDAESRLASTIVKLLAFTLALGNQLHPNAFNTRIIPDLVRFVVDWSQPEDVAPLATAHTSLLRFVAQQIGCYFLTYSGTAENKAEPNDKMQGPLALQLVNMLPKDYFTASFKEMLRNELNDIFDGGQPDDADRAINFGKDPQVASQTQISWEALLEKGAQDLQYGSTVYEGLALETLEVALNELRADANSPIVDAVVTPSQRLASTAWREYAGYNAADLDAIYKNDVPGVTDDPDEGFDLTAGGDGGGPLPIGLTPEQRNTAFNIILNLSLYKSANYEELQGSLELLNEIMGIPVLQWEFVAIVHEVAAEVALEAERQKSSVSWHVGPSWTNPRYPQQPPASSIVSEGAQKATSTPPQEDSSSDLLDTPPF